MNFAFLIDMLIGAVVGAFIGNRLGRFFTGKFAKTLCRIVPLIICMDIAQPIAEYFHVSDLFIPPTKVELAVRKWQSGPDSEFLIKATAKMSKAEATNFWQEKVRLGMKRLSYDDLKLWNQIRIKLAKASPALCADFWTGKGAGSGLINTTLNSLANEDVQNWFAISLKAGNLEIQNAPFTLASGDTFKEGVDKIGETLDPLEYTKFYGVLRARKDPSDEDACWVIMKILNFADAQSPKEQENFLKALISF